MARWKDGTGWVAGTGRSLVALATVFATAWSVAAEPMLTTVDLLKNPKFKSAYVAALGARSKERWLATMSNSAPVRQVTLAGTDYQVATPCKPHDCSENNLLLLYAPARGIVVGKLYEKGRTVLIGAPDASMTVELEKLWKKEFRQQ